MEKTILCIIIGFTVSDIFSIVCNELQLFYAPELFSLEVRDSNSRPLALDITCTRARPTPLTYWLINKTIGLVKQKSKKVTK